MSDVVYWRESDELTTSAVVRACPNCENDLTIHQPDPDLWNRLLATCDDCKSWFVLEGRKLERFVGPRQTDDGIRMVS
jgi:hypothetical protein